MDVGGALIDGIGDQAVDRADHRRIADQIAQPLQIVLVRVCAQRLFTAARSVQSVNRCLDLAARCNPARHRPSGQLPQGFGGERAQRIGGRDQQCAAIHAQRHDQMIT